jgi:hypothetical protein
LQSLYFLNSDFVHGQAEAFVRRLAAVASPQDGGAVTPAPTEPAGRPSSAAEEDENDDDELPEQFEDREMIVAAYPLLYGREVTDAEVTIGLEFLATQREAHLEEEMKGLIAEDGTAESTNGAAEAANGGNGDLLARTDDPPGLAERRASMKAWTQYARALFGAAEFRFIG